MPKGFYGVICGIGSWGGWKFRRQYPVGPFIVDFICVEQNIVIEVDGGQHAENEEQDIQRSAYLNRIGYRVL